jgi:NAD(P)H dehydrogenase (quinone)
VRVLILDGHPAKERLVSRLLEEYRSALPQSCEVDCVAVRDLKFDPVLHHGFEIEQPWEPDLRRVANLLSECEHLVVAFPLWWGAEPPMLKGLLDRLLLPGFAFRFKKDSSLWEKLLVGRSADVIVTMDTPPWYLRLFYADSVMNRWKKQILDFCGFAPVRVFRIGPTKNGMAAKKIGSWSRTLKSAGASVDRIKRAALMR